MFKNKNIQIAFLASITLGLAPFTPEPHLWGKLKWIYGGANGMQFKDWFDVLLHGTPWLVLIFLLIVELTKRKKT